MTFLMKTSGTKKVCSDFLQGFVDFQKIFCFNHPGLIFHLYKKGFLNSQSVRIRVKVIFFVCVCIFPS
jgi:hypothetical protein